MIINHTHTGAGHGGNTSKQRNEKFENRIDLKLLILLPGVISTSYLETWSLGYSRMKPNVEILQNP